MPRNLHSFRCTHELWQALQAHAEAHGIGVNALLESIAADYLGMEAPDSPLDSKAIDKLIAEAIEPVIARIEALEKAIAARPSPAPTLAKLGHKPKSPSQQASQELLTMGEAHAEAQRRGWRGSLPTFRRRIQAGESPGGVVPDWDERAKYPEKSNAARWLSFRGETSEAR